MPIPLNMNVFERGVAGVPSTALVTDLSSRAESYSHTISDQFGFESMQTSMTVTLDEAIDWLMNGLMRSIIVSGPEATVCWEGYLSSVSAKIGQKTVTLSLDSMANRITVVFIDLNGAPGTTTPVNQTTSQALYGIKDRVSSLDSTNAATAIFRATILLADLAFPKSRESAQALSGSQGDVGLTLSFTGWYGTLTWLVTTFASSGTAITTTQVGSLLVTYVAINNFLSTSTLNIIGSGINSPQQIDPRTTYREAIEDRLKLGTGTFPLAWGIYEDRKFYVETWAGAAPNTITYQGYLGDANVYDAAGGIVPPWMVRPNAINQVNDLLDVGPTATAPDAAARTYIGRVTCTISGDQVGVTLEPSGLDSVETRLAILGE